jgi:hypothetical protein
MKPVFLSIFLILFVHITATAQDTLAYSFKINAARESAINANNRNFPHGNGFSGTLYKRLGINGKILFNIGYSAWGNRDSVREEAGLLPVRIGYHYELTKNLYAEIAAGPVFSNTLLRKTVGSSLYLSSGYLIHIGWHNAVDINVKLNFVSDNGSYAPWVSFGAGYLFRFRNFDGLYKRKQG